MSAIPNDYQTATPYLIVNDAPRAIAFYKEAFRATEIIRLTDPSGKIAHAEIRIGHAPIMLADEQMGYRSPASLGALPSVCCSMWKMPIRCLPRLSRPGRKSSARSAISFMATGWVL